MTTSDWAFSHFRHFYLYFLSQSAQNTFWVFTRISIMVLVLKSRRFCHWVEMKGCRVICSHLFVFCDRCMPSQFINVPVSSISVRVCHTQGNSSVCSSCHREMPQVGECKHTMETYQDKQMNPQLPGSIVMSLYLFVWPLICCSRNNLKINCLLNPSTRIAVVLKSTLWTFFCFTFDSQSL